MQSVLTFRNTSTPPDYAIVNPFNFPERTLTVELWLKTDATNTGTPIGYSTKSKSNAFILFDYRSLLIYVADALIKSGIALNDGQWHHCAVTWESSTGQVQLYKDGQQEFSHTLSAGQTIPQGGALVLGQEQDSVGGRFDVNQAFRGQMAEVRIWNCVRTPQEIQDNMHDRLTGSEPNLALYWPLNEGEGTTLKDKTGNGNHGTIHGTVWEQAEVPVQEKPTTATLSTPKYQGSVLTFDGVDDYIDCGNGINLVDASFTLEFWAQRKKPNQWHIIFFQGDYITNKGLHFGFRNTNVFTLAFHGNDLNSPTNYTDTDWHHWCGVYDFQNQKQILYLDGHEICQRPASPFKGTGIFYIGSGKESRFPFEGNLGELRVWKCVRTPAEIEQNMHRRLNGNESGLVGYWPLDEGSGETVSDRTHNSNNGTLHGATWETAEVPIQEKPTVATFSAQQSQATGMTDYGYWYRWAQNLPKQTDKKPFRRGRIWS